MKRLYKFGTKTQVGHSLETLRDELPSHPFGTIPSPYLAFNNGTYDLVNKKLVDHSPEFGVEHLIPSDFLEDAQCPSELQRVIDTCYANGAEPILRALIRWTIDTTIPYGQMFHLVGQSGSGKGIVIDLLSALIPLHLQTRLPKHPAVLETPEKIKQFVMGRRLLLMPDIPVSAQGEHLGSYFELVENSPLSTRTLYIGQGSAPQRPFCRVVLASTGHLQFVDGQTGHLRRALSLVTKDPTGVQDSTLKTDLVGPDVRPELLGEVASWALQMPRSEVLQVLAKDDPEGLLGDAAQLASVSSDPVSLFIDDCLEPHPTSPHFPVDDKCWREIYQVYLKWCKYHGHRRPRNFNTFKSQVRSHLGGGRCLGRAKEPSEVAAAENRERRNLPSYDAGFTLIYGALFEDNFEEGFGKDGLWKLKQLPPAKRQNEEEIRLLRSKHRKQSKSGSHGWVCHKSRYRTTEDSGGGDDGASPPPTAAVS